VAIRYSHERSELRQPGQPPPRGEQRLLQCVLGVLQRGEHPVAVRMQLAAMDPHQLLEGVGVTTLGCREQPRFVQGGRRYRSA